MHIVSDVAAEMIETGLNRGGNHTYRRDAIDY